MSGSKHITRSGEPRPEPLALVSVAQGELPLAGSETPCRGRGGGVEERMPGTCVAATPPAFKSLREDGH